MTDDGTADLEALRADPEGLLLANWLIARLGDEREAARRFGELVLLHLRTAEHRPDLPPEPRRRTARKAAAAILLALVEAAPGKISRESEGVRLP